MVYYEDYFLHRKESLQHNRFYTDRREIYVALEYYDVKRKFIAFSDFGITKHFVYHGRCYDRTKLGNMDIYRKVLRMVRPFLNDAINEYFNY